MSRTWRVRSFFCITGAPRKEDGWRGKEDQDTTAKTASVYFRILATSFTGGKDCRWLAGTLDSTLFNRKLRHCMKLPSAFAKKVEKHIGDSRDGSMNGVWGISESVCLLSLVS